MRLAIVAHLFYEDIAIDLLDRIAAVAPDADLFVTGPVPFGPALRRRLEQHGNVRILPRVDAGRDVGSFLAALRVLAAEGYDLFCKLHTKRGLSPYASLWRAALLDGTLASRPQFEAVLRAFADEPRLLAAGPAEVYVSALQHMYRNAPQVERLARICFPARDLPPDWGFFAGTMFWGRVAHFARLTAPLDFKVTLETDPAVTDGATSHAFERLFGMVGMAPDARIGLIDGDAVNVYAAPGPLGDRLDQRLARRSLAATTAREASTPAAENPLIHYIRHADTTELDPNPLFHSAWYRAANPDAAANPLLHFREIGEAQNRNPSPLFDVRTYKGRHRSLLKAAGSLLAHHLEQAETLPASAASTVLIPEWPGPPRLDPAIERAFLAYVDALPEATRLEAAGRLVSVVLVGTEAGPELENSLRAVLLQTHTRLELLIAGPIGRRPLPGRLFADERIRWVGSDGDRPGGWRNDALAAARGELIAYLESGREWHRHFLETMVLFMEAEKLDAATALSRSESGGTSSFMGQQFDWQTCLDHNIVDLNTFVHRASLVRTLGGFDPALPRGATWELVLRYGRGRRVGFAPVLACESGGEAGADADLAVIPKLVHLRDDQSGTGDPAAALTLHIAIKTAAPRHATQEWGDAHFAEGLRAALTELGHEARIDFRGEWDNHRDTPDDVVIVLRGLIRYRPRPEEVNLLWLISHPDQVGFDEMDDYDQVCVASLSYARLLRHVLAKPVGALLQATDPGRFRPGQHDEAIEGEALFVGNGRGRERPMLRWAVEAGIDPVVFGEGWDDVLPEHLIAGGRIDNARLPGLYHDAGAVLNDHWEAMREYGFVSNRVFDVLAAEGALVSDEVSAIGELFGDAVPMVGDAAALAEAVRRLPDHNAQHLLADFVRQEHSFDRRAEQISAGIAGLLGLAAPAIRTVRRYQGETRPALRVHAIAGHTAFGFDAVAYLRLIAPMTHDSAHAIDFTVGRVDELSDAAQTDVCVVQNHAIADRAQAQALLSRLGRTETRLVVDIDDTFGLESSAEAADALDMLLAAADQAWFATAAGAAARAGRTRRSAILPNALDPRFWRNYGSQKRPLTGHAPIRMLMITGSAHDPDIALILPALDHLAEIHPGAFQLTVLGVAHAFSERPWLNVLTPPPTEIIHPRFARWMAAQGPFDIGLAPLADTRANRLKSDLAFLDYAALGVLPVLSEVPAFGGDIAARNLAVLAANTVESWIEVLDKILTTPRPYAAIAGAATEYLWQERSVARLAESQQRLLGVRAGSGRRAAADGPLMAE